MIPFLDRYTTPIALVSAVMVAWNGALIAAEPAVVDDPVPRPQPVEAPSVAEFDDAINGGIEFLLADQNSNGSWGNATRTKSLNIYAPVPGAHDAFQTAVTALSILALYETGGERDDVRAALDKAETWLLEHLGSVRRANEDALYNVWTHCYGLQCLLRMEQRTPAEAAERRTKIAELIELQFDLFTRYESVDGGWGYYDLRYQAKQPSSDSMSFVNAAVLIAFHEARDAGHEPPQRLVDRAVAATLRQRLPDDSFLYGEYLKWKPRMDINRPGGSLGRTQACNLALRLWGDQSITDQMLIDWLDRLAARNGWLDIGRKRPVPHEAWFSVAGYFYYFGHYYASRCIQELPSDTRPPHQAQVARLILDRQEKDGSWWDYPLYDYHQPYGTSFALMTLARCR
ncbi:MAG: terpene cyclase/mutase family protein [Planctomycetaceae bacterium]|nr:terpene cyclase/mutase family protein [Planctomycetaceae bacterium]